MSDVRIALQPSKINFTHKQVAAVYFKPLLTEDGEPTGLQVCKVCGNETRWGSAYGMLKRYYELHEFISAENQELVEEMPSPASNLRLKTPLAQLADVESVLKSYSRMVLTCWMHAISSTGIWKCAADIDPWILDDLCRWLIMTMTVDLLATALHFRPEWIYPYHTPRSRPPSDEHYCTHLITADNIEALLDESSVPDLICFGILAGGLLGVFLEEYSQLKIRDLIAYWESTHKLPLTKRMCADHPRQAVLCKGRNNRRSHAGDRWRRILPIFVLAMQEVGCGQGAERPREVPDLRPAPSTAAIPAPAKRRKVGDAPSAYVLLSTTPPTSNIVEGLFGSARIVLRYEQNRFTPFKLEMIIFLKVNQTYWGVTTVDAYKY
ncbi:hypothetical protein PHMEG_00011267 [Phytophthora megakarya]|uniref:HAT C-terminal dimerisation domain-containing protein n=1 Tax=Phytophthora megakarya TaxID=4795 RepID=A0A225WBP7_9STRA|nr:hypothetical protein PHMEG_00011267 [Phytophthora megakarya]